MSEEDENERIQTIQLIGDSAAFMASAEQVGRARRLRWSAPGFDRTVWEQAAAMGWLGLRVPEEAGGVGLGTQEVCALAEVLGRGLAPEPLVAAISIAPLLNADVRERSMLGQVVVLPAWQTAAGSGKALIVADGRLSGEANFVSMAKGADDFLVDTGSGLATVEANAPGLSIEIANLQDGGHFGTLRFVDVAVDCHGGTLEGAIEEMTLGTAAYLLGVMRHAFEITAEYLRTRQQFDRPIGSFQSLQHRMADLYAQIELTAASVAQAARSLDQQGLCDTTRQAVSRAKARASDAAMLVTKQAIHLHGGIGFTDEADIGLFLRKALTLANLYGSSTRHRARYAAIFTANAPEKAA